MTWVPSTVPHLRLACAPAEWSSRDTRLDQRDWASIPQLSALVLADGSGPAAQQTVVRLCADRRMLYVRFDCDDHDIWASYTQRDDPIYEEEVVEIFLSPGHATPTQYYEFEVSPGGVLFDARIANPTGQRRDIVVDRSWNCDGIRWNVGRDDAGGQWWAVLTIPWAPLTRTRPIPTTWRANFYRIERPRAANPEFSCWSPTMTDPADFHKPAYFGSLALADCDVDH